MDPLPLLKRLVAANSINPSLVPGAPGEAEVAEVVRLALVDAGLDVVVQEVAPGRPNVVGVLEGREPGPTVMLCGHIDTVGVEGMADPFVPRVEGGRLYGRGAQDMKGGVAAMVAAAALLLRDGWSRGRLVVAAVADEEHMSLGAEAVAREWVADAAIVTEPTDLTMAIGHKGFVWLEVETRGRAAHGSRPAEGRDAIAHMGRVLVALEALDRDLQSRPAAPFQGTGSLHASIIRGGRELSVYPDHCVLEIERRTVAGEDEETARRDVDAILRRLSAEDAAFDGRARVVAGRPPHCLDADHPLARAVSAALADAGRSGESGGMSFWTDAAILSAAGTPSLLFGPGGAGLHSVEEYVNIEDVYVCRDVLADAVRRFVSARA
jgi:acetylornithine deacetylase